MKNISKYFAVILLLVGILLMIYPTGKNYSVQYLTKKNLQKINGESDIEGIGNQENINEGANGKENTEKEITYNFKDVTTITMKDIIKAINENLPVSGTIKIPSVDLELSIIEGVSNSAMSAGAGTLKPNQRMGKGNYALASHHMRNPNLLFSPLDRVEIGAKVYLHDGKEAFEYTVIKKEVIAANKIDVIEDKDGQALVTLITCHENGEKRLMVVGELNRVF